MAEETRGLLRQDCYRNIFKNPSFLGLEAMDAMLLLSAAFISSVVPGLPLLSPIYIFCGGYALLLVVKKGKAPGWIQSVCMYMMIRKFFEVPESAPDLRLLANAIRAVDEQKAAEKKPND